ncbi:MAG TPA: TIGR00730 family Rossman fold protein [Rhizomicrobium sp.]|nr:TIGR00730 family Rossman fold protein [Rhizomicrobium sp.]
MDKTKRSICVFCGSSPGNSGAFAEAARETGRLIAAQGYTLVFGGGGLGLMGETARAVRDSGAPVTGILPEFLRHLEPPLARGEQVRIVPDLYRRKDDMMASSDAFLILPGGLGTLDEFFEVVTSAQLGVHNKPIVVLNTERFYGPLQAMMEHVVRQGFAKPAALDLYRVAATPAEAMAMITQALGS